MQTTQSQKFLCSTFGFQYIVQAEQTYKILKRTTKAHLFIRIFQYLKDTSLAEVLVTQ